MRTVSLKAGPGRSRPGGPSVDLLRRDRVGPRRCGARRAGARAGRRRRASSPPATATRGRRSRSACSRSTTRRSTRRWSRAASTRRSRCAATLLPPDTTAYRLVNGEGDRLPGVVVDRYGDFLVCQLLTAGAARLAPALVDALQARLAPRGIYERSEGGVRAEEGLRGATRRARGRGAAVAARGRREHGMRFLVDVVARAEDRASSSTSATTARASARWRAGGAC